MQRIRRQLLGCMCVLALWQAGCRTESDQNVAYRCQKDGDCLKGESCLEHLCRSSASLQGGVPASSQCATSCSEARQLCCSTSCVSPDTDPANCGGCGHACASGEKCVTGKCSAERCDNAVDDNQDGFTDCADTQTCPDSTACHGGVCCHAQCVSESSAELCSNNADDDCDGKKDCEDTKCLGQSCGAGKLCLDDHSCAARCFIDGKFQAAGDVNPQSSCFVCNPATNLYRWSPVAGQTASGSCKDNLACDGHGQCRRVKGLPCAANSDCASAKCFDGACGS